MGRHTRSGRIATNAPSNIDALQQPLQQQHQKTTSSCRDGETTLPKFVPLYRVDRVGTSTDSLSEGTPANASTTVSRGPSFNDLHDSDNFQHRASTRRGSHLHIIRDSCGGGGGVSGVRRMQPKLPSRRGSLEHMANLDAVARCVSKVPTAANPFNTAPPPRLSRRASASESTVPCSVNLAVGGGSQTSSSRCLSTPLQMVPAAGFLRRLERESSFDSSRSRSQDHVPPFKEPPCRSVRTSVAFLTAVVPPEDCRRAGAPSLLTAAGSNGTATLPLAGDGSFTNPVTLMVSTAGAPANGPASSLAHVLPGEEALPSALAGREEGPAAHRRASAPPAVRSCPIEPDRVDAYPPLSLPQAPSRLRNSVSPLPSLQPRRRRNGSIRDASTSPSVDSAAADENEAVARGRKRASSLTISAEANSTSPATGPRRVHFNLQDPLNDSVLLGSPIHLGAGEERRSAHCPLPATAPVALNTSPPMTNLSINSLDCSARQSPGTDLHGSLNNSSSNSWAVPPTKLSASSLVAVPPAAPAAPTAASTVPTLSLRLNLKDGRIEALPTTIATVTSAGGRSSFSNSSSINENLSGATYKPQVPLPKPALKSYSRYNGDAAGGCVDAASASGVKTTLFNQEAKSSSMVRGVVHSLQRIAVRYQRRRGSAGTLSEGPMLSPLSASPQRYRSSEVVVKWSLLGMAALLSILLILLATAVD
ncbi:hypothetical protein ABB37_02050 [Leptomonas pyrrhocoris]|uniref:Uncharacterized protein n=1 Tax=Leptomonas pyrrhocoris TaxID=157538 RepID=A0A0M9G748_LEPPY|nr:hypothetical protein ABB37_02050 [Leptomonas pyrrhocoris]KPA83853.1 hypothetical protein ABB37_02050 [Leptomonas pyrrhocoris]|eukprot:XP_015662292.1 hypothetical protein ABB37_02050 [Leptomonas pyrrhocoris]